jgi:FkbM family methyltransferase
MKKLSYTVLPEWISENVFFQVIFLMRKLFLTKLSSKYHSQFAEDVTLDRLFKKQKSGFFVDVGCYHPIKFNNTYKLYKRGWRGVNIDIDSIKILGFKVVRMRDENVCCAISNNPGELTLYTNGIYSLTTSISPEFTSQREGYHERKTHSKKLSEVLDSSRFSGKNIDFLSIDVEGADLEVLKSLDFERYKPQVVAVESHQMTIDEVLNDEIFLFLSNLGYKMIGWNGLTLIFCSKNFIESKKKNYL